MKPYLVTPAHRPTWGWARDESTSKTRRHLRRKVARERVKLALEWAAWIVVVAFMLAMCAAAAGLPL